ncbi:ATP-dependent RecD-like DNA helicase [Cyanobium sp. CH-040]|uniref:ATP-dependent DNA helicase n=1 Tax=Cyanobium sp. CH-040 TaxID=2823708 RepID=UPI0020CC2E38|nr:AAA family ATPase [Cyanobium sp. CH-040]MCP9927665.1 AAA family ATPase [Cyanobium sp. CH-040]
MSPGLALADALVEALPRLCTPQTALDPRLGELIRALAEALEGGALELDLSAPPPETLDARHWPQGYRKVLQSSGLVVAADALESAPQAPLVLAGERLRWRRWHLQLEHTLAALVRRARQPLARPPLADQLETARREAAAAGLDPAQQQAVTAALSQPLLLLSGGPGTGKTSTVVQLLLALQRHQPGLRLQLAAPTGKAASRLREAIAAGSAGLEPALAAALLAAPCTTLHRLLESSGERFGRDARRPLELDLLVVDEVSMVDLPLMTALLEALPAGCRLVLVGDAGQLPPVGPGAVLQELMRPRRLAELGPAAVELRTAYRNAGAIAAIAADLRQAGATPLQVLEPRLRALGADANLQWRQAPPRQPPAEALAALRQHQRRLGALAAALADAGARALLEELERCVLLTPVRLGQWGVAGIHRQLLGDAAGRAITHWPLGTPVLNRRNLPEQGLANGDVGVLVAAADGRRVLFPGGRLLHPALLGQAEPALALTVHKSQGSQYGTVWLLLPPGRDWDARLLYTGLTRARQRAWLITPG